jgi:hypothetical protein
MRFEAQHNTQIHTQSKIAKIAKKYTKIHRFLCSFLGFWAIFMAFYGHKSFLKKWVLEGLLNLKI